MRLAAAFFAALLLASCAPDADTESPSRLEGTVTDVSIVDGSVTEFEMLTTDGEARVVTIDPARDYGFDLLHLEEHADTADPVIVDVQLESDDLVALSIEDV